MRIRWLLCSLALTAAVTAFHSQLPDLQFISPAYASRDDTLQSLPNFRDLIKKAGIAVVTIKSIRKSEFASHEPSVRDSPHQDDELAELFRRILPPEGKRRDSLQSTFGCGFILSTDGLILTDSHLLDNASEIWVRLRDSRSFKAKILGRDALTDVALIKIDAAGLPIVRIGDPNKLEVGDWVLAIGAPFGFEHSVTQGIVSATGRALPDEYYVPFIQTDVSINPGNSGGPLFNMDGEVVAINSQIYTRSGGYMGISFAIPIDLAMGIKEQLLKDGKVTRGRLGVSHQAVDETIAQAFHLETVRGALITEVDKNSPAEKAGIVPGDIVLKFDGATVQSSHDLPRFVANAKPGKVSTIELWRKGQRKVIDATIEERQSTVIAKKKSAEEFPIGDVGLTVRELTATEKRDFNLETGLFITNAEGEAALAGLMEGDVILAVNDNTVTDANQFQSLFTSVGPIAALLVSRRNMVIYIPLRTKSG
jgi:serine protease Do